jgi:PAS domain S-box-containing protein
MPGNFASTLKWLPAGKLCASSVVLGDATSDDSEKAIEMPTLKILKGRKTGQNYDLTGDSTVLGRHPNCDLVLPDETVSRHHARIIRNADTYYVEDLSSRNGTYLNGRRVDGATRLNDNDHIQIHEIILSYHESPFPNIGDDGIAASGEAIQPLIDAPRPSRISEILSAVDVNVVGDQQMQVNADVKLQAVLEITRNLGSSLDVEQVLHRILESVFRIFPQTERGYILQSELQSGELMPAAIKQRDDETEPHAPITFRPINRAIAHEVMSEGKAILSTDSPGGGEQSFNDSVFDVDVRSMMCAPLIGPSRNPLGVIYVDTQDPDNQFQPADLEVLVCVAILAGQAAEHATLHAARFRAVVDTAVHGIITINHHGTIESVNPAVERLFGYDRHDLVGRNIRALIPGDASEAASKGIPQYLRPSTADPIGAQREAVGRRQDGSAFPLHLSIGEFELDGQKRVTAIIEDITQRKRAEQQLQDLNKTLEDRVEQRTEHVKLLQDAAVIANEAEAVPAAFQAVLDRLCRYLNCSVGHAYVRSERQPDQISDTGIWSLRSVDGVRPVRDAAPRRAPFSPGDDMIGRVFNTGLPEWIADMTRDDFFADEATIGRRSLIEEFGVRGAVAFPVFVGKQVAAVLEFFSTDPRQPDEALLEVMVHIGTQLGRVIERSRMQQQLIDAAWNQQRQFGQELHDSVGQELTGVRMMATSLVKRLQSIAPAEAEIAGELTNVIKHAQMGVRRMCKGLFPVEVDAQGLMAALEDLTAGIQDQSDLRCVFRCEQPVHVHDNSIATHLFRIAQEAISNAAKHAQAREIVVRLSENDDSVFLSISDDGVGLHDPSPHAPGMGLHIMRYRANVIGAKLTIEQAEGGGTLVQCTIERKDDHVHSETE